MPNFDLGDSKDKQATPINRIEMHPAEEYLATVKELQRYVQDAKALQSDTLLQLLAAAAVEDGKRLAEYSTTVARAAPPVGEARSTAGNGFTFRNWAMGALERFLKSFGSQEIPLWAHFLLVLTVLVFSVAIGKVLPHLEGWMPWLTGWILGVCDVCAIAVVCAECVALLMLSAATEFVQRLANFPGLRRTPQQMGGQR